MAVIGELAQAELASQGDDVETTLQRGPELTSRGCDNNRILNLQSPETHHLVMILGPTWPGATWQTERLRPPHSSRTPTRSLDFGHQIDFPDGEPPPISSRKPDHHSPGGSGCPTSNHP